MLCHTKLDPIFYRILIKKSHKKRELLPLFVSFFVIFCLFLAPGPHFWPKMARQGYFWGFRTEKTTKNGPKIRAFCRRFFDFSAIPRGPPRKNRGLGQKMGAKRGSYSLFLCIFRGFGHFDPQKCHFWPQKGTFWRF